MSANLDFCCQCNAWIGANEGKIRLSDDGTVEIVCDECSRQNDTSSRGFAQHETQTTMETQNG